MVQMLATSLLLFIVSLFGFWRYRKASAEIYGSIYIFLPNATQTNK